MIDYETAVSRNIDIVSQAALSCCKNPQDGEDVQEIADHLNLAAPICAYSEK